jgi:indolepyruvate ferredoxin oxidoreductase
VRAAAGLDKPGLVLMMPACTPSLESLIGDRTKAREVGVSRYKLPAYKDEYEVARLYVDTGFFERIDA